MHTKKLILSSLIFLGFILQPSAHTQAGWYQVEVIIFDCLQPELDGELWFKNLDLPSLDLSIELINDLADPVETIETVESSAEEQEDEVVKDLVPYLSLPKDKFRLKKDFRRLKRLKKIYRPLMHVAWQQEGLAPPKARKVHLEKPIVESESKINTENSASEIENEVDNEEISVSPAGEKTYIAPEMIVNGFVRLKLQKYLHLDVDFSYFPKDMQKILRAQNNAITEKMFNKDVNYIRLTESRKIKLNELNYFDNPLFGVLIQVSRIKLPEKV